MRCHRDAAEPVLVCSSAMLDITTVLQVAVDSGVSVVLDCGGADGPISEHLLTLVACLSPNETELARLTGAHLRVLPFASSRHCSRATHTGQRRTAVLFCSRQCS